jgi:hypothetical protein
MSLSVILDAMEGKPRGPLDFDTLKRDLRELGANLRVGFEEAGMIKKTHRLNQNPGQQLQSPGAQNPGNWQWSQEFNKALRKVKAANTRKYSLQQATLSVFGGGAFMAIWYHLLNIADSSGLLRSIELIILQQTGAVVVGLAQVLQVFWMLGLIPVARGVGHLFNGIFFAPKKIDETQDQIIPAPSYYATPVSPGVAGQVATNELERDSGVKPKSSVTEDETLRFEPR